MTNYQIERKIEAILFAASEPLELETIEKRIQTKNNVKKYFKKCKMIIKIEE